MTTNDLAEHNHTVHLDVKKAKTSYSSSQRMKEQYRSMTRPWPEILAYYENLAHGSSAESMSILVQNILTSRYVSGIYAWTSMLDLCIVQKEVTYPYNGPFLRVSPLSDDQLEFRYIDTLVEEEQWHRVVPGKAGFARLEKFFYQVRWFYPPGGSDDFAEDALPSQ